MLSHVIGQGSLRLERGITSLALKGTIFHQMYGVDMDPESVVVMVGLATGGAIHGC